MGSANKNINSELSLTYFLAFERTNLAKL